MTKLIDIEGIGPTYAQKLKDAGIGGLKVLLRKGSTPKGRAEIAKAAGISEDLILKWVNHADLFRIKGVAGEYSELLEAAGVDTVVELAQRNVSNLVEKMNAVNLEKKLVRRLPVLSQVERWVLQAKELPRAITY